MANTRTQSPARPKVPRNVADPGPGRARRAFGIKRARSISVVCSTRLSMARSPAALAYLSTAGTMRFGNRPRRRGVCIGALRLTGLFPV